METRKLTNSLRLSLLSIEVLIECSVLSRHLNIFNRKTCTQNVWLYHTKYSINNIKRTVDFIHSEVLLLFIDYECKFFSCTYKTTPLLIHFYLHQKQTLCVWCVNLCDKIAIESRHVYDTDCKLSIRFVRT